MSAERGPLDEEPGWVDPAEPAGDGGREPEPPPENGREAADAPGPAPQAPGAAGTASADEPSLGDVCELVRQLPARIGEAEKEAAGTLRADIRKLEGIAGKLDKVGEANRALVEKTIEEIGRERSAWADRVEEAIASLSKDSGKRTAAQGRRRRWLRMGALAMAIPVCLLIGMLAQKEYEVIPRYDDSGGWRQWIWEGHGQAISDCAAESRRLGGPVECRLSVRWH